MIFLERSTRANFVLGSKNVTAQQAAEARFLRALHYYHVIDLWGSAPYREIGTDPNAAAPVYTRAEGTAWIISELEAILTALPAGPSPTVANQNAAHWLLAKIYLNKGVFTAANPAGPYTFDPADMAKVVSHVDAITGRSMAADYWDNFQPDNTQRSSELIFVSENIRRSCFRKCPLTLVYGTALQPNTFRLEWFYHFGRIL